MGYTILRDLWKIGKSQVRNGALEVGIMLYRRE